MFCILILWHGFGRAIFILKKVEINLRVWLVLCYICNEIKIKQQSKREIMKFSELSDTQKQDAINKILEAINANLPKEDQYTVEDIDEDQSPDESFRFEIEEGEVMVFHK